MHASRFFQEFGVDRVWRRSPLEHRDAVLNRHQGHLRPCLSGRACDVRGEDYVGEREQSGMDNGFFFVDIKSRASDPPLREGLDQRLLMDNRTSSGVDQERCRFHRPKLVGADQVVSFRSQ